MFGPSGITPDENVNPSRRSSDADQVPASVEGNEHVSNPQKRKEVAGKLSSIRAGHRDRASESNHMDADAPSVSDYHPSESEEQPEAANVSLKYGDVSVSLNDQGAVIVRDPQGSSNGSVFTSYEELSSAMSKTTSYKAKLHHARTVMDNIPKSVVEQCLDIKRSGFFDGIRLRAFKQEILSKKSTSWTRFLSRFGAKEKILNKFLKNYAVTYDTLKSNVRRRKRSAPTHVSQVARDESAVTAAVKKVTHWATNTLDKIQDKFLGMDRLLSDLEAKAKAANIDIDMARFRGLMAELKGAIEKKDVAAAKDLFVGLSLSFREFIKEQDRLLGEAIKSANIPGVIDDVRANVDGLTHADRYRLAIGNSDHPETASLNAAIQKFAANIEIINDAQDAFMSQMLDIFMIDDFLATDYRGIQNTQIQNTIANGLNAIRRELAGADKRDATQLGEMINDLEERVSILKEARSSAQESDADTMAYQQFFENTIMSLNERRSALLAEQRDAVHEKKAKEEMEVSVEAPSEGVSDAEQKSTNKTIAQAKGILRRFLIPAEEKYDVMDINFNKVSGRIDVTLKLKGDGSTHMLTLNNPELYAKKRPSMRGVGSVYSKSSEEVTTFPKTIKASELVDGNPADLIPFADLPFKQFRYAYADLQKLLTNTQFEASVDNDQPELDLDEIEGFDRQSLRHVDTDERQVLPTKDDIDAEYMDAIEDQEPGTAKMPDRLKRRLQELKSRPKAERSGSKPMRDFSSEKAHRREVQGRAASLKEAITSIYQEINEALQELGELRDQEDVKAALADLNAALSGTRDMDQVMDAISRLDAAIVSHIDHVEAQVKEGIILARGEAFAEVETLSKKSPEQAQHILDELQKKVEELTQRFYDTVAQAQNTHARVVASTIDLVMNPVFLDQITNERERFQVAEALKAIQNFESVYAYVRTDSEKQAEINKITSLLSRVKEDISDDRFKPFITSYLVMVKQLAGELTNRVSYTRHLKSNIRYQKKVLDTYQGAMDDAQISVEDAKALEGVKTKGFNHFLSLFEAPVQRLLSIAQGDVSDDKTQEEFDKVASGLTMLAMELNAQRFSLGSNPGVLGDRLDKLTDRLNAMVESYTYLIELKDKKARVVTVDMADAWVGLRDQLNAEIDTLKGDAKIKKSDAKRLSILEHVKADVVAAFQSHSGTEVADKIRRASEALSGDVADELTELEDELMAVTSTAHDHASAAYQVFKKYGIDPGVIERVIINPASKTIDVEIRTRAKTGKSDAHLTLPSPRLFAASHKDVVTVDDILADGTVEKTMKKQISFPKKLRLDDYEALYNDLATIVSGEESATIVDTSGQLKFSSDGGVDTRSVREMGDHLMVNYADTDNNVSVIELLHPQDLSGLTSAELREALPERVYQHLDSTRDYAQNERDGILAEYSIYFDRLSRIAVHNQTNVKQLYLDSLEGLLPDLQIIGVVIEDGNCVGFDMFTTDPNAGADEHTKVRVHFSDDPNALPRDLKESLKRQVMKKAQSSLGKRAVKGLANRLNLRRKPPQSLADAWSRTKLMIDAQKRDKASDEFRETGKKSVVSAASDDKPEIRREAFEREKDREQVALFQNAFSGIMTTLREQSKVKADPVNLKAAFDQLTDLAKRLSSYSADAQQEFATQQGGAIEINDGKITVNSALSGEFSRLVQEVNSLKSEMSSEGISKGRAEAVQKKGEVLYRRALEAEETLKNEHEQLVKQVDQIRFDLVSAVREISSMRELGKAITECKLKLKNMYESLKRAELVKQQELHSKQLMLELEASMSSAKDDLKMARDIQKGSFKLGQVEDADGFLTLSILTELEGQKTEMTDIKLKVKKSSVGLSILVKNELGAVEKFDLPNPALDTMTSVAHERTLKELFARLSHLPTPLKKTLLSRLVTADKKPMTMMLYEQLYRTLDARLASPAPAAKAKSPSTTFRFQLSDVTIRNSETDEQLVMSVYKEVDNTRGKRRMKSAININMKGLIMAKGRPVGMIVKPKNAKKGERVHIFFDQVAHPMEREAREAIAAIFKADRLMGLDKTSSPRVSNEAVDQILHDIERRLNAHFTDSATH